MKKKKYPVEEATSIIQSDKKVMLALHRISSKIVPDHREVFLSGEGYGYVWCFKDDNSFDDSGLCRICNGEWEGFNHLAEKTEAPKIISDLREAYNNNEVTFRKIKFENPHYISSDLSTLFLGENHKFKIDLYIAYKGGDKMAQAFEQVLMKYDVDFKTGKQKK